MDSKNKQEIVSDICCLLDIEEQRSFYSTGSKVTKEAIFSIYERLSKSTVTGFEIYNRSKHGLIKHIAAILGVNPVDEWFSTGSTVTAEAYKRIYFSLKEMKTIEEFEETTLPVYYDSKEKIFKSLKKFEEEIEEEIIKKEDLEEIQNTVENYGFDKIKKLTIERINQNPTFKYFTLDNGEYYQDDAIKEVQKKRSSIGQEIIQFEKEATLMSLNDLESKYFN